jgi:hypothetical protein
MAMKRMLSWWKGLIALVVVVAFAFAMAWLLRGARQGTTVGQPEVPTPERMIAPTDILPPKQAVVPSTTLSPTSAVTVTAAPGAQETARILYAVQSSRGAATLWTLDLTPGNKVLASSELPVSPIPVEGLRLYEISISPDGRYAALNLRGRAEDLDVEVWTVDLVSGAVTQLPQLRQSGIVFMD